MAFVRDHRGQRAALLDYYRANAIDLGEFFHFQKRYRFRSVYVVETRAGSVPDQDEQLLALLNCDLTASRFGC